MNQHLTSSIVSKYGIGRREWSIFELVRLLSSQSDIETDDQMFNQTPIVFRRIKTPTEKVANFEQIFEQSLERGLFIYDYQDDKLINNYNNRKKEKSGENVGIK